MNGESSEQSQQEFKDKQRQKRKRFDNFYMRMAVDTGRFSYCNRKKVGCIFVKDDIIFIGYNGTISGFPNECEDENGETKLDVLHAESNIFAKIMNSPVSSGGGTMYCTLSPCINCAKQMIQAKIGRFLYLRTHSDQSGLILMQNCGIIVEHIEENDLYLY